MTEMERSVNTGVNMISVKSHFDGRVSSGKSEAHELLLSGLAETSYESARLAAVFWEMVWPKLEESGWEKVVSRTQDPLVHTVVLATKKSLDIQQGVKGKDYFVRIKDVIDRINLRKNSNEATLADRYRRAISKPLFRASLKQKEQKSVKQSPIKLDLSWKDGGKHFPKKTSMIGKDHQVSSIPRAGKYNVTGGSRIYCQLVWDPAEAKRKGINLEPGNDVLSSFVPNLREAAFLELPHKDYNLEALQPDSSHALKPSDGSDWSKEQKEKFHGYIFRYRRNLQAVSKAMNLPLGICHSYYLAHYKNTPDYVLLKAICSDEKNGKANNSLQGFDACSVCGDGGSLIICDGCEGEYHMKCLKPPLLVVPEGHWLCDECVDRRVVLARDNLFRKSDLFVKAESNEVKSKKRPLDGTPVGYTVDPKSSSPALEISISSLKEAFIPSPAFAEAVYTLSTKLRKTFSRERDQIST